MPIMLLHAEASLKPYKTATCSISHLFPIQKKNYGPFGSNHSETSLPKLKNLLINMKLQNLNPNLQSVHSKPDFSQQQEVKYMSSRTTYPGWQNNKLLQITDSSDWTKCKRRLNQFLIQFLFSGLLLWVKSTRNYVIFSILTPENSEVLATKGAQIASLDAGKLIQFSL